MEDVRWKQRFQNYSRKLVLLREALRQPAEEMSDLENEGTVYRFGRVMDLAWKTLKDYLEYEGISIKLATPQSVLKEAFAAGVVSDGQVWIDMLAHRNLLSRIYDEGPYQEAVQAIGEKYVNELVELHEWLIQRSGIRSN